MKFDLENIEKISNRIINYLKTQNFDSATVLALHGDLGAGKTTLTQNISSVLGVQSIVNSPTFVIQKKYKIINDLYNNLIHIDAYRINDVEEVKILGLEKEFNKKENLIIIEWPLNIKDVLPNNIINIYLDHTEEESVREIRIEKQGEDITTLI